MTECAWVYIMTYSTIFAIAFTVPILFYAYVVPPGGTHARKVPYTGKSGGISITRGVSKYTIHDFLVEKN